MLMSELSYYIYYEVKLFRFYNCLNLYFFTLFFIFYQMSSNFKIYFYFSDNSDNSSLFYVFEVLKIVYFLYMQLLNASIIAQIIFYLSLRCFYRIRLNLTNVYNACALCFDIYFSCPRKKEDIVSSTKDMMEDRKLLFDKDCLYLNIDSFLYI